MFVVSFLGGFLGVAETMVHTTLDKAISRIFPGQITVFEDCDLVNKSAFLTFTPFFKTLLDKTGHGVIYDFTSSAKVDHIILYYFPQQRFGK